MNIIPKPQSIQINNGFFRILPKTRIILNPFNPELRRIAEILSKIVEDNMGKKISIIPGSNVNTFYIHLSIEDTGLGDEGYRLNANARYIKLSAEKPAGLFYGIQTILQLLPADIFAENPLNLLEIPVCKIEDKPHFSWRGMHLDVSRHFFPVSFIKRYIDYIAFHITNRRIWYYEIWNVWIFAGQNVSKPIEKRN